MFSVQIVKHKHSHKTTLFHQMCVFMYDVTHRNSDIIIFIISSQVSCHMVAHTNTLTDSVNLEQDVMEKYNRTIVNSRGLLLYRDNTRDLHYTGSCLYFIVVNWVRDE